MSERMVYITLSSKCTLVLPEKTLWKYLPPDELELAIKRGKAYKRTLASQRRQEQPAKHAEYIGL